MSVQTMTAHVRTDNDRPNQRAQGESVPVLTRKGTALHWESHGQGSPILLTHGFGATCRMWDEQIEEFTDRHRLIVWDLPGHGQSGTPAEDGARTNVVEDMRALLNKTEAERPVLAGLGLGGLLALRFWRANPARVRALVLIGTVPGLRSTGARALWNARVEAAAAALDRDGLHALEGGAEADPRAHADAHGLAMAARRMLTRHDPDALPWLAAIDVPVLIVAGGEDRPSLSAASHMARVIPNAALSIVPRANHAANLHKPDAVNAAIRDFLGRLPP